MKYVSLYFELFKGTVCGLPKGRRLDMSYVAEDFDRLIVISESGETHLKFDFLYYCLYNFFYKRKSAGQRHFLHFGGLKMSVSFCNYIRNYIFAISRPGR